MIPTDVLGRLRADVAADRALQPVAPAARLADILADFQPGQRIMAQIQALLPNGAYRAVVGQREITLALPFSAKAGDSLELEVVDNEGQLSLALTASKNKEAGEAFSTSFSRTGQLIAGLLQNSQQEQGKKGVQLNGGIPLLPEITDSQPLTGETLAPVLQKAVSDSGMFYEAHQAQWVNGQQSIEQLLKEPQGRLSSPVDPSPQSQQQIDITLKQTTSYGDDGQSGRPVDSSVSNNGFTRVPESLTPIVQQQFDTLSNQTLHWQGQVWPGQVMEWEVEEQQAQERNVATQDEDQRCWRTRLRLELPGLGTVEATLLLRGTNGVEVQLQANHPDTQSQLRNGGPAFQKQLENAGLQLNLFGVRAPVTTSEPAISQDVE